MILDTSRAQSDMLWGLLGGLGTSLGGLGTSMEEDGYQYGDQPAHWLNITIGENSEAP